MSKTKKRTVGEYPAIPPQRVYVKNRWAYYLCAFMIPAILTFIAYMFFKVYPAGTRSVLTLDLNGQYVYYFEAIRDAFWGGRSMLYSWARNLSGGFQGVIGYYLASPFTFIIILLPKKMITESIMIMQICKVGACGLTFCAYAQKSKNVPPLQSVIFSTAYALMAYVAIQLIDPMWIDGPIFLPLIMLGVEYLIDEKKKANYIIPLAIMFIANFYIGFMVAIFTALYFAYYLFLGKRRKFRGIMDYVGTIGLMFGTTTVALLCSYIMIMPVYNALALGKFDFSTPDYSFKTMFNPIELVPCLLPDQYYSVNVDEGTRLYGRPEIYCGVLTVCLVPLYYMNKKIDLKRKIGYSLLLVAMFVSMYIKPVNMMWHGGQDPNWLPYRYSFLVSFILVSMACEAFANLESYKLGIKGLVGIFVGLFVLVYMFDAKMESFNYNEEKYKYVAKFPYSTTETYNGENWKRLWLGTIAFGLVLAFLYLAIVYFYSKQKSKKTKTIITCVLGALVCFEACYNTYDTFWKIHKEVYYSERDTYDVTKYAPTLVDELENYDNSLYRAEKTFFRSVNDNQAWGLRGISHSSSVMNTRAIKFIETLGYTTKSYETRYDGNTPVADSLLGIKYVFNDPAKTKIAGEKSLLSPYYKKVYTTKYINSDSKEADVDVYENPDALPIGFMADDDILKLSFLGNDNPFNSMNNFMSSMTGNTPDYSNLVPKSYFVRLPDPQVELAECWESDYNGQHCYNANAGAVDPTVRLHITSESKNNLYMYLKSNNAKKVNLWVSTEKDENGNYINHKGYGSYFEGYDYCIVNLGSYPVGTEIEVRLTILKENGDGNNEYVMVKDFQFYHLDYDAFHEDVEKLKANPWNIDMDKSTDSYLTGTVNAQEGQIFYTSIPYEPGWTIKVDGKKVDPLFVDKIRDDGSVVAENTVEGDTGQVVILNALIGLKLTPGEHTVSMKYSPPGFNLGIILLIAGAGFTVFFFLWDRKHNKAVLAEIKMRERMKKGLPPTEEEEQQKSRTKSKRLIKSKGSPVKEDSEEETERDTETDSDSESEDEPEQQKKSKNKKSAKSKTDEEDEDDSDSESEDEPEQQRKSKGKKSGKSKTDDEEDEDDSDSESEDEPEQQKKSKSKKSGKSKTDDED